MQIDHAPSSLEREGLGRPRSRPAWRPRNRGYDRGRRRLYDSGERMSRSIVVGPDGSDTAKEAVTAAVDPAREIGATLDIVPAYEPVPQSRLREEARQAPE